MRLPRAPTAHDTSTKKSIIRAANSNMIAAGMNKVRNGRPLGVTCCGVLHCSKVWRFVVVWPSCGTVATARPAGLLPPGLLPRSVRA